MCSCHRLVTPIVHYHCANPAAVSGRSDPVGGLLNKDNFRKEIPDPGIICTMSDKPPRLLWKQIARSPGKKSVQCLAAVGDMPTWDGEVVTIH
jgi:hypothetical protein